MAENVEQSSMVEMESIIIRSPVDNATNFLTLWIMLTHGSFSGEG
jgi:hypothetical protein